jgi:hypothetical protein
MKDGPKANVLPFVRKPKPIDPPPRKGGLTIRASVTIEHPKDDDAPQR